MLSRKNVCLLVVDIQEKLLPRIHNANGVLQKTLLMIRAARLLNLPVIWAEQYPKGLGKTVPEITTLLNDMTPFEKTSFSLLGDNTICNAVRDLQRDQILITGIEAHVCVLQTALSAIELGYSAFVLKDAIGSQHQEECDTALERMSHSGAHIATVEMTLFELIQDAASPDFKAISTLLKEASGR